ncbi:DUF6265 family protein [Flavobacterium aciduliphilum]|uniref:DUF6265 domain-containing protein n=1 Tax=Flavobacterium aciduliphilum TaxID=1101402 RepID=A0A328YAB0_9FLAO|nr:DUF6265 family protein [Flavobacterium aciduliphilum]RAR70869.1 hypothetical protein CLV55_109123 [Flavobacterium aciduliphilum]
MKKIVFLVVASALVIGVSCKKYDAKGNLLKDYDQVKKAEWLLGNWEKKDSMGILTEHWEVEDDSSYVGQSYFIINSKDTVHNENIELVQDGEHLIYFATVKGENNDEAVPFQMTKQEDSLMIFENPKHDYPQKIEYKLQKNGSLIATISGKQRGKISSESYPMRKVN